MLWPMMIVSSSHRGVEREQLEEMKRERENPAFPDLNGKYVGFIVHTKRGYKPCIGTPIASPGDNDSFIHVVASREAFGTPEEALATFETCGVELVRVFKTPTTPGGMMGHWLRWLIEHEEQQSPK
jgi:hypothetical protein